MEIELQMKEEKIKKESSSITTPLLVFAASFGLAMMSGFYFYFVPHSHNWRVSQIVLIIHFASGFTTFLPFIYFVIKHQREKEKNSLYLFAPWKALRKAKNEATWHYRQRLWGHALYWSIIIVLLSSFVVSVPAIFWYFGKVWLPGYAAYQFTNATHFIFSVVATVLIWVHFGQRKKRK